MRSDGSSLDELAREIANCKKCDNAGLQVIHGPPLTRGGGSHILVIGEQPGTNEFQSGEAFSGPAGQRLMKWLIQAGIAPNREELFKVAHFTSLCKCRILPKDFPKAVRNCFPYLERQISIVNPRLIVTLGQNPIKFLLRSDVRLNAIVGHVYTEAQLTTPSLVPLFPVGCLIAPLPHPSPRNRWLNSPANLATVDNVLREIRNSL